VSRTRIDCNLSPGQLAEASLDVRPSFHNSIRQSSLPRLSVCFFSLHDKMYSICFFPPSPHALPIGLPFADCSSDSFLASTVFLLAFLRYFSAVWISAAWLTLTTFMRHLKSYLFSQCWFRIERVWGVIHINALYKFTITTTTSVRFFWNGYICDTTATMRPPSDFCATHSTRTEVARRSNRRRVADVTISLAHVKH